LKVRVIDPMAQKMVIVTTEPLRNHDSVEEHNLAVEIHPDIMERPKQLLPRLKAIIWPHATSTWVKSVKREKNRRKSSGIFPIMHTVASCMLLGKSKNSISLHSRKLWRTGIRCSNWLLTVLFFT
jgi:hypothetical protein